MKLRAQRLMRLVEANPKWSTAPGRTVGITFDCPIHEEDAGSTCRHFVPFANPIGGGAAIASTVWHRSGETFEMISLTPSIRRIPHEHKPECAEGCIGFACAWHGYVTNGALITLEDSR